MDEKKPKNRDPVGKISLDLQSIAHEADHTPDEQMREQLSDYEDHMKQCIERCKKTFIGNFYIVVLTKKERLMKNVLRNFFMGRQSCPTPEYDQAVYRYHRLEDRVEFMWVVPAKDVCIWMLNNPLEVPPEDKPLLQFVMDFNDNTLFRRAKTLNGEQDDSPLLVQ